LNGISVSRFASDDVRRVIGGCLADPYLFDSTIRENIRLARPGASHEELDGVVERVRLRDWIESLPLGWDTPVGTHGSTVSGGQRQRIALARALLADPAVMILDEPTAHLDQATGDALMDDVRRATRGRTLLLITHDLRYTSGFDEVVELAGGRRVA
jgi:ATP-binding cassette subfamily C protein CydC